MIETPADVRPARWLWIAAIWCAGGLIDASQTVLVMRAEGTHHAGLSLFATEFVSWLPWALATPLVIRLARRYPVIRITTVPTAAVHLAAFAIISLIAAAWSALLQMALQSVGPSTATGSFTGRVAHVAPLPSPDIPLRVRADIGHHLCGGLARKHGPPANGDGATQ